VGVAAGRPVYVVKIDPKMNTVYLGDLHHLQSAAFTVLAPNWLTLDGSAPLAYPFEAMIKIRYNTPPTLGRVELAEDGASGSGEHLKVTLYEPQSAITPGQIAAFYDTDFRRLYGGGYIDKHLTHQLMSEADWQDKRDNLPNLYCQVGAE